MTDTDGYNGWANRETWLVPLWINNEQGSQEAVHELLRSTMRQHAQHTMDRHEAGVIIREWTEQEIWGDEAPASLATDLLGGALARVDWDEVGESFLTDVREQDEYEARS